MKKNIVLTIGIVFVLYVFEALASDIDIHSSSIDSINIHGIAFPKTLAGLARTKVNDYEEKYPGLGSEIVYSGEIAYASIFVYDLKLDEIPEGPMSDVVMSQFQQALRDVYIALKRGQYDDVKIKDKYGTGTPDRGREYLCAELYLVSNITHKSDAEVNKIEVNSYIYVTGFRNKFIKIRFTIKKDKDNNSLAREFSDKFARILWPSGSKIF